MPNSIVVAACEAIVELETVAQRLAQVPVTVATCECTVDEDNTEFRRALDAAQIAVEQAMDEVDGLRLGLFQLAAEQMQSARTHWFTSISNNRVCAHLYTENALRTTSAMHTSTVHDED